MALADFNRSNPFVIQMRNESDRLNSSILNLSKNMIVLFVLYFPTAVLCYFGFNLRFFGLMYFTLPLITTAISLAYIVKHADTKKVNDILYGNTYKDIYVNNEEIYDINCMIRELIGRASVLKEFIVINIIAYLIFDAISILILLAKALHF